MAFIVVGVVLILLKFAEIGPVATMSWGWVLSPFPLAAAWWMYSDSTGRTRRLEMEKLEDRKLERRRKNLEALGIDAKRVQSDEVAQRVRKAAEQRLAAERELDRTRKQKTVRDNALDSTQSSSYDTGASRHGKHT